MSLPDKREVYYVDVSECGTNYRMETDANGDIVIVCEERTPAQEAAFRAGVIDQLLYNHNDFCRRHGLPERKQETWRDRPPML